MEGTARKPTYFANSIGSTIETLQYFSLFKVKALLNRLSKKTKEFYDEQKNLVFGSCLPTVFTSVIEHQATFKGGQDRFIIRILHLRETLFLVATADNVLEIMDLSSGAPVVIDSM